MLGGFLVPDQGEIFLAGKDVTDVPPYRRDVNTVFQSYALFEHLNVAENVAFGLKRKRVPRKEIVRRVGEMLELVNLSDRAQARPRELSGGQQQRVALARALVNMPALLLLDEPLGALDLKLRRQMQVELKTIQREMGITFVFVTHDQEEALTMSDRIAVMNHGRLEQVAPAAEIYERPATAFAAGFIGASNMLSCTAAGDHAEIDGIASVPFPPGPRSWSDGDSLMMAIRPEKLFIAPPEGHDGPCSEAVVADAVFLGATTQLDLRAGSRRRVARSRVPPAGGRRRPLRAGRSGRGRLEPGGRAVLPGDRPARAGSRRLQGRPEPVIISKLEERRDATPVIHERARTAACASGCSRAGDALDPGGRADGDRCREP